MFTPIQGQLPVTNNTISLSPTALSLVREQDRAAGRAALPGKDWQPPGRQDRGTISVEWGLWSPMWSLARAVLVTVSVSGLSPVNAQLRLGSGSHRSFQCLAPGK